MIPYKTLFKSILLFFIIQNSSSQIFNQSQIDSIEVEKQRFVLQYADPSTGKIPFTEIEKAREELLKKTSVNKSINSAISPNLTWYERGPKDLGGDMRCVTRDLNDVAGKKYWAGSVGGGLWFNNDITDSNSSWQMVNDGDNWPSLNISWITFNPSNTLEMYVATGDYGANFGQYSGSGIYKSTDGGITFIRINSTIPNSSVTGTVAYAMQFINKVIINTEGIFVQTWQGLLKSTDGGDNWSFLLTTPYGTDLEIGNDGILYAAFGDFNNSKVYKSTNTSGTSWSDITPNSTGGKTQIGLGNSANSATQVIYAVSISNGTAAWFKKSINGGITWTNINVPNNAYGYSLFNHTLGHSLNVHPQNSDIVILGGYYIAKTLDGGASWTSLTANGSINSYNTIALGSDNQSIVVASATGIYYSPDFANITTTGSALIARNKNIRLGFSSAIALKNIVENGLVVTPEFAINNALHSLGTTSKTFNSYFVNYPAMVNQTNNNQVVLAGNLYDGSLNYLKSIPVNTKISDWDYFNNKIYSFVTSNFGSNNTTFRITQLTTDNLITSQDVVISTLMPVNYIKVGKTANTIFVGYQFNMSSTSLVKVTNINTTPVVTSLSNGQLPSGSVSSIDLGATENEILVTYSNFGVSSVWYTNNGGTTWVNKDELSHGLPNIPVKHAVFAPSTPKVILATSLGIFTTNNITDTNPSWEQSNTGLPNVPVSRIAFRTADSVLAISTEGRGVFTAAMRGFIYPTIDNKFNKSILCFGGTANIPFDLNGTFANGTVFNVELSDALGVFTSPTVIGSGTTSPVSITLPTNISTGTNYKIRIKVNGGTTTSNESSSFLLQNKDSFGLIANANGSNSNGTYKYCSGSNVSLFATFNISLGSSSLPFDWSGPNAFTGTGYPVSIINAGISNQGTYTTSIAMESCKLYTATVSLTLTSTPTLSQISPRIVCPGQSFNLNSSSEVIYSQTPSYAWSGPNSFFSTQSSPTLTNVTTQASGIYTLTATYVGGCSGKATATNSITVSNNLPGAAFYSGLSCSGANISFQTFLNASTSGLSLTYSWSGPGGFSSNISNPTISNFNSSKAGVYTSTITYTGTCSGSSTSTINLTMFTPSVYISGTTAICQGGSSNNIAQFSNSSLSVLYSWAGPNGFSSNGVSLGLTDFNASKVGSYTVTASYSGACTGIASSSVTLSLESFTAYVNGSRQYCIGGTTELVAGTNKSGQVTYSWAGPNSFTSTGQNLSISNFSSIHAGIYTLSATFTGSCISTATATVTLSILTNPRVYINLNGTNLCPGANTTLSTSGPIPVVSYQWSGPDGFNSTQASATITGMNANKVGLYSLTAVLGGGCNVTSTASVSLNMVNSAPSFVLSTGSYGGEYCLVNTGGIYIQVENYSNFSSDNISSINWTGPNGLNVTNSSRGYSVSPVSAASSGLYSATISFNGCPETRVASNIVTLSNIPKVTPFIYSETVGNINPQATNNFVANACDGNIVILDGGSNQEYNGIASTAYSWTGPNGFSVADRFFYFNAPITAAMAGIYTLTATITGGSCAGTASSTVQLTYTETPEPTITYSPENARIGDAVTFASNCTQFSDWSFNSSLSEPNSIVHTPTSNVFQTVKCVTNGCISKPSQKIVFNDCHNSPIYSGFLTNTKSKFESNDQINSITKISPVSNIVYDSQKSILLNPGFEVLPGSTFKAVIDGCGND
ncbi:3-coathanger stack domain-containing protein [Lacihabitans soyangensis]|uniref:Immunoglobulin domain-containing protein n=1 Tax=Lacihabitans soyangensis TaxID=869394 RepID=A0AAE3H3K9_9BACT|nr:3-coathanger stack domain-containing protein [Lacihabitans soyangensis]MCP9763291.1 hypothetical protein [Lacihabitans soyangensis]